jgi:hypothetical protein
MKLSLRILSAVLVMALVAGFAIARPAAAAAPVAPAMPQPTGLTADVTVDQAAFAEVVDITQRITPYLSVGEDGQVVLKDVTAAQLGVTEEFLSNYRAAMKYSNALIANGELKVAPDMKTTLTSKAQPMAPGKGIAPEPVIRDGADAAASGGAAPTWGGWDYGQGAMFYNSYNDWTYYRYNYYPLCNTMAAYIARPWMSSNLCYFYGYNSSYFNSYCYNGYGTYYYMPYSYCSNGLGYKPAYFWTRSYYYTTSCGCYNYNWNWQMVYCRY